MSKPISSEDFLELCKKEIVKHYSETYDYVDDATGHITTDNVFVVWYSKSLQNHKALLSTTIPDGTDFELTYNGDKHELYLDAYKKWKNKCISIPETLTRDKDTTILEIQDKEILECLPKHLFKHK